jgi:heavy metal sensor kinase
MTIRIRLTLYWAAVLAGILAAAGISTFLLFQRQQWARLDGALIEEAETAAETISRTPSSGPGTVSSLAAERDLGANRRVSLSIGGRTVAESGDRLADLPRTLKLSSKHGATDGSAHIYRYAIASLSLAGAKGLLIDGVDATDVRNSIARLRRTLLVLLPAVLIASVAIGYWLAGRALVPINSLATGLSEIDPRDLRRRLPVGEVGDEVARLAAAINRLLERIEHASAAERRFAADAAHELRTPLAVLRSGLEVTVSQNRDAPEYAEAIHQALRDVDALCRLTDELLALARLEQDASFERHPLNLRSLAQEVVDAVEPLAQAKDLSLEARLDSDAVVNGNANYLRRLMINLLDNALKFTPEHGRIEIGLDASNGSATLRVADNGPGIPDADIPHLFERFFRGKTRAEAGSGLGLSICREIVRLHHGDITANSSPDGGAEFIVRMPTAGPAIDCA